LTKKRIFQSAVVLFLCFTFTLNISRAEYTVGVKSGDWIRYDITVTAQGQTAGGSIKITVQNVQGLEVSGTYEINVQGYQIIQPQQFTLDITTGSGGYASGFIIPANLTVGNVIPGEGTTVETIKDWHGRKAIVANASVPSMGFSGQIYWDQATGIFLESSGTITTTTYTISLAETSLWSGRLFGLDLTMWIVIIVVVVVVVAVVGIMLSRRRVQAAPPLPQAAQPIPPPPPPPP
jgi:hypothetical protein